MRRLVPQSELIEAPDAAFRPELAWSRLSFLELLPPHLAPRAPPWLLEPAYDEDGATLVAVWPSDGTYDRVRVATWAPDSFVLARLVALQTDWPPALCDVRVRLVDGGKAHLRPCESSLARQAMLASTELAQQVRYALDRGARRIGRSLSRAA